MVELVRVHVVEVQFAQARRVAHHAPLLEGEEFGVARGVSAPAGGPADLAHLAAQAGLQGIQEGRLAGPRRPQKHGDCLPYGLADRLDACAARCADGEGAIADPLIEGGRRTPGSLLRQVDLVQADQGGDLLQLTDGQKSVQHLQPEVEVGLPEGEDEDRQVEVGDQGVFEGPAARRPPGEPVAAVQDLIDHPPVGAGVLKRDEVAQGHGADRGDAPHGDHALPQGGGVGGRVFEGLSELAGDGAVDQAVSGGDDVAAEVLLHDPALLQRGVIRFLQHSSSKVTG